MVKSLCKFGIGELELRRSVFTTDRGSNMIVALRDQDRIDCAAHVLNTVLRNTFDNKNCPEPIRLMIKAVKELVRYLKKTSLQNLMQKQVKQSRETRWNSTFLMLKSIDDAHGRSVTSLGRQGGRRVFREGPKFFTLCPIDLNYLQKLFSRGGKKFSRGLCPPW